MEARPISSSVLIGSPKKTDSLLYGSSGSTSRPSVIRPLSVRLQERNCWQALYQATPLPSSAQEKRARGLSICGQPAWNDSGAVFEQTAEALRYALLDAHWFHRHGLRIEAELVDHRCVRNAGCQYSDIDT